MGSKGDSFVKHTGSKPLLPSRAEVFSENESGSVVLTSGCKVSFEVPPSWEGGGSTFYSIYQSSKTLWGEDCTPKYGKFGL